MKSLRIWLILAAVKGNTLIYFIDSRIGLTLEKRVFNLWLCKNLEVYGSTYVVLAVIKNSASLFPFYFNSAVSGYIL